MNDLICTETAFFFYLHRRGFIEASEMTWTLKYTMQRKPDDLCFTCYTEDPYNPWTEVHLFATPEAIIDRTKKYNLVPLFNIVIYHKYTAPHFLRYVERMTDIERKLMFISAIESLGCNYFKNPKLYRERMKHHCWSGV